MKRPRVIVHVIQTVDGRITTAAGRVPEKDEFWASVADRVAVPLYRKLVVDEFKAQVSLVGSETILLLSSKEPRPLPPAQGDVTTLYEDYLHAEIVERVHSGMRWFTVLDSRGRVRWAYKESDGQIPSQHLLVLVARRTPAAYLSFLREKKIPYLVVGEQRVDLRQALERLGSKLGVECVVAGGGGRLNGALLRADLIDEVSVIVVPAVVGGEDTPASFDAPELAARESPLRLRLISSQVHEHGTVWLRYEVVHEQ